MDDPVGYIVAFLGGATLLGAIAAYLLMFPEKAEKIGGWVASGASQLLRRGHRRAIALKVQGAVNSVRAQLLKNAPDLLEKKLKIRWADVDEAEALLREGEVLVVMKPARHHEENVAHAVMAYLPKALIPRARPYLDKQRMRAADLVVAKSLLSHEESPEGALPVFYEQHLDPARAESDELRTKIGELDELDLNGWLSRVLLAEYQLLGNELHPGEPDPTCLKDSEEFARWLSKLAGRAPGTMNVSLSYKGQYFRVAIIFVAIKGRLETEGLVPYRKRAKRLIYQEKMDAIYLMGRDDNIDAVAELAADLERDALVAAVNRYTYALRSDFKKRKAIARERATIICLRRRKVVPDALPEEALEADDDGLEGEVYEPDFVQDESAVA